MVQECSVSVNSFDELTEFVHRTLCDKENLLSDQYPLHRVELCSRGRPCGMQFSLYGPRSVRLGAIWASDQNQVFFYDTRGERFLKVKLSGRWDDRCRSAS